MRKYLHLAAVALSTLALSSCQSGSHDAARDSQQAAPTAQWQTLAADYNGFFAKAHALSLTRHVPRTAAQMTALVGYDFADGVALAEYDMNLDTLLGTSGTACFTGPEHTYLTLTITKDTLTRTLGTGACDYTTGDITLATYIPTDSPDVATLTAHASIVAATITRWRQHHPGRSVPANVTDQWLADQHALISYDVHISDYTTEDGNYQFCLSRHDTYLTYSSAQGGPHSLGTDGSCDFDGPAVPAPTNGLPVEHPTKGETLAHQIPALTTDALMDRFSAMVAARQSGICTQTPNVCLH